MDEKKNGPSAGFDEILATCTRADFDGHTEFANLTPEQRLDWLYQAATFVFENRGVASKKPLTAKSA